MPRNTRKKVDKALREKAEAANKVLYSFRVKADHLERLKSIAQKKPTTVTKLLETMIEQYLKN